jgi:hypothetical protein
MTNTDNKQLIVPEADRQGRARRNDFSTDDFAALNDATSEGSKAALFDDEKELFRELVRALRTIRYGSIVLTVHEGQLVEINKSIRIRKGRPNQKD